MSRLWSSGLFRVSASVTLLLGSVDVASAYRHWIPPIYQGTLLTKPQSPQTGGPASQEQNKIYQKLLAVAETPFEVAGHPLDLTVDMNESRPPSDKNGPGVVSGVFAEPPDLVGKLTFIVFSRPDEADTFMTGTPNQMPHILTFRGQLPDGLTQSFSVADAKGRFPGQLTCYFVHPPAVPEVSALCGYHLPGTSLVGLVFVPEEIKSTVPENYTGSTDTKNITINFIGAAAGKLFHSFGINATEKQTP